MADESCRSSVEKVCITRCWFIDVIFCLVGLYMQISSEMRVFQIALQKETECYDGSSACWKVVASKFGHLLNDIYCFWCSLLDYLHYHQAWKHCDQ